MKKTCLLFVFIGLSHFSFSQSADSTRQVFYFRTAISLTNNGFSFLPSFSLGKPAAIINLNINGGKRWSFDPEFRFSLLDAKPWSFIFIWRYKLINRQKFQLSAGAHLPAVPFRTIEYEKNGVKYETLANYRFLPFELSPQLHLHKNISLSAFYLYSYGFGDATRHTNFLSLRANFFNIPLSENFAMRFNPQLFYLQLDAKDGYYFAAALALTHRRSPFSISSMMNKSIKTTVAGRDFDWNVSLIYTLDKKFTKL